MDIIVKKTTELSETDKKMIVDLFESIFNKKRPWEIHANQYTNNCLGYSWHALLYDNGIIVGLNSYVPAYYMVASKLRLFANSFDTMIAKPYRDFFSFYDLTTYAHEYLKQEGVFFIYGYPNDNSYPVVIKGKISKDIGKMRTYCLPYRVGGIKPSLKILNGFSILFAWSWSFFSSLFASKEEAKFMIQKDRSSYNDTRYKRGDADYCHVDLGDGYLHYKIKEQDGVRTAFIIDIDVKSSKNFNRAVRFLLKHHSKDFDLILYPGWLPFWNTGMIKLPRKVEPKNFNFTGKMLAKKGEIPEEIWNIENWDTNLSNYDLI